MLTEKASGGGKPDSLNAESMLASNEREIKMMVDQIAEMKHQV
jgi:hypothetical protein